MNEDSEEPQPGGANSPLSHDAAAEVAIPEPGLPWGRLALGAAIIMAGTAAATLAATHNSARHENAKAYVHGMNDMLKSVRESLRSGVDPLTI
jgi:hypothetical protein